MDTESTCGTSSEDSINITENSVTSDVLAKLRRLKIRESLISASLEKGNFNQDDNTNGDSLDHILNWKTYSSKIKNNIHEIKNMFEDIKIATTGSEDNLKNIDIEEIKKEILNLNTKIKYLDEFINTELKSLQSEEKELIKQMTEEPPEKYCTRGKVKIQSKQYNEVVPSPVRVLINSPLKCIEVQEFQAFMSKSKNRYGGWNEYNHNIFIQIWNKYYATDDIMDIENNKKEISRNNLLPQFKNEVYEKIPGIQLDDILSHSKWYSEFCYLKRAQQLAVEKWRDNKRKMKGRPGKDKDSKSNTQNSNNEKLCRKQNETVKCKKSVHNRLRQDYEFERNQSSVGSNAQSESSLHAHDEILFGVDEDVTNMTEINHEPIRKSNSNTFATPTEQWINRCNAHDDVPHGAHRYANNRIENIEKLCIPNWRLSLHKY